METILRDMAATLAAKARSFQDTMLISGCQLFEGSEPGSFHFKQVETPNLIHSGGFSIIMHMSCHMAKQLAFCFVLVDPTSTKKVSTLEKQLRLELQSQAALRDCQLQ